MALGTLGWQESVPGLVLVNIAYGTRFITLYFRNSYASFPTGLIREAQIDGAGFFRNFRRILLPVSGPIAAGSIIWQFTNIWNDFLIGTSFGGQGEPMKVALDNIVAGRFFVRGLMAGSVKG